MDILISVIVIGFILCLYYLDKIRVLLRALLHLQAHTGLVTPDDLHKTLKERYDIDV